MPSVEKWCFEPQLVMTMFELMYQLVKAFIDSVRVNHLSANKVRRFWCEDHSFLSATCSCGG